jgi:dUTP pyrophosphatase
MIFFVEVFMERCFEKISFKQFCKDVVDDKRLYDEYRLPERKTMNSAGYDFMALNDFEINPGETLKIPTGYKAKFLNDEVLFIIIRSSLGFKFNIRMMNQVGVIESDYYNNIDNEGHIWVALKNEGDKILSVKKGESYVQGIFLKFLTCGDIPNNVRVGGIGSTNKEEKNE